MKGDVTFQIVFLSQNTNNYQLKVLYDGDSTTTENNAPPPFDSPETYAYDANGNQRQIDAGTNPTWWAVYDYENKPVRMGACHDVNADGFVTETDEGIVDDHQASEGQALYDYHYDVDGDGDIDAADVALVTAQVSTSCPDTANIDHDGNGLRISRNVGGTTTDYVWDIAASLPVIVQETTNDATTSYVYGLDLVSATDNSNVTTYFLQDGLGSTTGLTGDDGAITDTYTYDVFGASKTHSGASSNAWLFTGELNDTTTARSPYYLRARYYDPAIGRFLSRDPWAADPMNPQSLDLYSYAFNNPLRWLDPFGLRNAEGGYYCRMLQTPTPDRVPTPPPMTPRPGYRRPTGGGGDWLSGMVRDVRNAVGRASCQIAPSNPVLGGACALLSPEMAPMRDYVWSQVKRSSNWFVNTCPGQITKTATGAAMVVAGVLTSEQGWGVPLTGAGLTVIFAGPPGSMPLDNCPGP